MVWHFHRSRLWFTSKIQDVSCVHGLDPFCLEVTFYVSGEDLDADVSNKVDQDRCGRSICVSRYHENFKCCSMSLSGCQSLSYRDLSICLVIWRENWSNHFFGTMTPPPLVRVGGEGSKNWFWSKKNSSRNGLKWRENWSNHFFSHHGGIKVQGSISVAFLEQFVVFQSEHSCKLV